MVCRLLVWRKDFSEGWPVVSEVSRETCVSTFVWRWERARGKSVWLDSVAPSRCARRNRARDDGERWLWAMGAQIDLL